MNYHITYQLMTWTNKLPYKLKHYYSLHTFVKTPNQTSRTWVLWGWLKHDADHELDRDEFYYDSELL